MNDPSEVTRPPRRHRWLRLEAALLAVIGIVWLAGREPTPAASARWLGGAAANAIDPLATLPAELPLQVELTLTQPMHVYVASHDMVRGTIAMLPSSTLRSELPNNPLPAGTHRLPGRHDGLGLQWHVGDGVGATTFFLIASERPVPELRDALLRCRQMGNAAFPKRTVLGTYAPATGMDGVPPRHQPAGALLQAARAVPDPLHDGPLVPLPGHDGVFVKVLRVSTTAPEPAGGDEALRTRIRDGLGPLDGAFEIENGAAPAGR